MNICRMLCTSSLCFLIACTISCSNPHVISETTLVADTIRNLLIERNDEIEWTDEIVYTPQKIIIEKSFDSTIPIYPYLEGFGSLNTTSLPSVIINEIKKLVSTDFSVGMPVTLNPSDIFSSAAQALMFRYEMTLLPPVSSFRFGKPTVFSNDSTATQYEVPLRLYFFDNSSADTYCDTLFFVSYTSEHVMIEQVSFGNVQHES